MGVGALAGFAGGLESGFQNYQQAQETKQDIADKQAKVQMDQMAIAEKSLPYYQATFRNNPQLAHDPTFIGQLNQHAAPLGLKFDPQTGIPANFGDLTQYNPDAAAKTQAYRLQGIQSDIAKLVTSGAPPEAILGAIRTYASFNKDIPGVNEALSNYVSDSNFGQQLQEGYESKINKLNSQTGLNNANAGAVATMMQYKIAHELASINQLNASAAHSNAETEAIPQRLAFDAARLQQGQQNLMLRGNEFIQRGQQATTKDRIDTFNALNKSAADNMATARSIMNFIDQHPAKATPQLLDQANNLVENSKALKSQANQITGMPGYKPSMLPAYMRVNQTFAPGSKVPGTKGAVFTGNMKQDKNGKITYEIHTDKGIRGWVPGPDAQ